MKHLVTAPWHPTPSQNSQRQTCRRCSGCSSCSRGNAVPVFCNPTHTYIIVHSHWVRTKVFRLIFYICYYKIRAVCSLHIQPARAYELKHKTSVRPTNTDNDTTPTKQGFVMEILIYALFLLLQTVSVAAFLRDPGKEICIFYLWFIHLILCAKKKKM